MPGGTVEQGEGELLLRTLGRVMRRGFDGMIVATKNDTRVRIRTSGGPKTGSKSRGAPCDSATRLP